MNYSKESDKLKYEHLKPFLRDEARPEKQYKYMYKCPHCSSGHAEKGKKYFGACEIKGAGLFWYCHSCRQHGDIVDYVQERDGLSKIDAIRYLQDKYNGLTPSSDDTSQETRKTVCSTDPDFLLSVQRNVAKYAAIMAGSEGERYLIRERGLTPETIRRCRLGYNAGSYDPFGDFRRRIIIPFNRQGTYYIGRSIDNDGREKYTCMSGVERPLYNEPALYAGKPCFVVEAPLCSISIMQAGGNAVALSGIAIEKLLAPIKEKRPAGVLLLALDNDDAGQKAQRELIEKLEAIGNIPYKVVNPAGDYKDPNEALQHGKLNLDSIIKEACSGELEL